MPEFYTIFVRNINKIPEFYVMFARKIFSRFFTFFWRGDVPPSSPRLSGLWSKVAQLTLFRPIWQLCFFGRCARPAASADAAVGSFRLGSKFHRLHCRVGSNNNQVATNSTGTRQSTRDR